MLTKYKIRTQLLLPIITLGVIFIILIFSIVNTHYSKVKTLQELQNAVELAIKISNIIHETQKERGLTSGFLTNNGLKFKQKLLNQRLITDKTKENLSNFLLSLNSPNILKSLRKTLNDLKSLDDIRIKVDNLSLSAEDAIKFYSKMDKNLLLNIGEISRISNILLITQNIDAYESFLYAKENAGIQRAVGINILSVNKFDNDKRVEFIKLISIEKLYIEHFLDHASVESQKFYKTIFIGKCIKELEKDKKIILNLNINKQSVKINPIHWFENITKKINKLKEVDSYLEEEIIKNINLELSKTNTIFYIFAILSILSIFIFLVMIVVILRLIQSERRLKVLIDKYIISSTSDLKGKIIEVSEAYCKISGYTEDELLGKPHSVIRHPDMPKEAFADMWKTIKSGKVWHGEVKNLKKDGGFYWVEANVEPLFDSKGKIEAYTAIRLNITESKKLHEKVKKREKQAIEQKEYLNTVIESSNSAIIALDENQLIRTYNKKAEEIFGFKKSEMLAQENINNIIPEKYHNILNLSCRLYFKNNNRSILGKSIELNATTKDGGVIPLRVSFGVSDSGGNGIIVANILDVSKEKEQDQMLKQQSKLAQMGEMISMIAHQWRQPLNAISLTSSIINMKAKKDKLENEKVIELTHNISEYSHHLSETINDFREFFKSDKKSEETNFTYLVNSVLKIIEDSIINKNIEIIKNLECNDNFVSYPNELKQVVLNLIKNAEDILLEKKIENPYIKINTYRQGNKYILEVNDNGGGISKQIINNIFDPYFSTKKQKDGTGLGLYMSKTIIEKHCNGSLEVLNNEVGALFRVTL